MTVVRDVSVWGAVALFGLIFGPAILLVQAAQSAPQVPDNLALVVFPPWVSPLPALEEAGWRPVGPTKAPFAILATPFEAASEIEPAWLVLSNDTVLALCLPRGT